MEVLTTELPSQQSHANLRGSNITEEQPRRFACDRCRGQKLRCLRDDVNQDSCKRCCRAKVVCVSSSPLRMGRPARAAESTAAGRRSGGRKQEKQVSLPSAEEAAASSSTVVGENTSWTDPDALLLAIDMEEAATNPKKRLRNGSNRIAQARGGAQSLQTQSPERACTVTTVPRASMPLDSPLYATTYTAPEIPMSGGQYVATVSEDHIVEMATPLSNTFEFDRLIFSEDVEFGSGKSVDETFGSIMLSSTSDRDSTRVSTTTPAAIDNHYKFPSEIANHDDPCSPPRYPQIRLASQQRDSDAHTSLEYQVRHGDPHQPMGDANKDVQHKNHDTFFTSPEKDPWADGIQQLSELNLNLYQQLKRVNTLSWADAFSTSSDSKTYTGSQAPNSCLPIGDILSSSQKFADVLRYFLPSSPSNNSITSFYSLASSPSTSSTSEVLTDAANLRPNHRTNQCTYIPSTTSLQNQNSSNDLDFIGPSAQPDTPTALSIITCYIRLTRIYSTIFSYIHKTLLAAPSDGASLPSVLPDLGVSGFSLRSYRSLQIIIFVEVSVFLLDRIEEALGLPDKYRLKERGDKAQSGSCIFGESSSMKLMEIFIRLEEMERPAYGTEDPKSLRKIVKRVKRLLQSGQSQSSG